MRLNKFKFKANVYMLKHIRYILINKKRYILISVQIYNPIKDDKTKK